MSAQEKTSGLRRDGHTKKERAPTLQKWRMEFHRLTASRRSSTGLLKRLRNYGCDLEVLEELLYNAAATGESRIALAKRTAKESQREVQSFLSDLNLLVQQVRRLNSYHVPPQHLKDGNADLVINPKKSEVMLEWFGYLPELLASYGQYLEHAAARLSVKTMDDHGPELTMLATYVKAKTGRALYDDLFLLLDDAHTCVKLQFRQGSEAIRKTLARYRRVHPGTCKAILEGISNYENLPISIRGSLVAHIRWELSNPRLIMDQLYKAGKVLQVKGSP